MLEVREHLASIYKDIDFIFTSTKRQHKQTKTNKQIIDACCRSDTVQNMFYVLALRSMTMRVLEEHTDFWKEIWMKFFLYIVL